MNRSMRLEQWGIVRVIGLQLYKEYVLAEHLSCLEIVTIDINESVMTRCRLYS